MISRYSGCGGATRVNFCLPEFLCCGVLCNFVDMLAALSVCVELFLFNSSLSELVTLISSM
jgi:hypothetical protein